jgi:hypothetical protein
MSPKVKGPPKALRIDGIDLSRASEFLFSGSDALVDLYTLDQRGYENSLVKVLSAITDPMLSLETEQPSSQDRPQVQRLKDFALEEATEAFSFVEPIGEKRRESAKRTARGHLNQVWHTLNQVILTHDYPRDCLERHLAREAHQLGHYGTLHYEAQPRHLDGELSALLSSSLQRKELWPANGGSKEGWALDEFLATNVYTLYRIAFENEFLSGAKYSPSSVRELPADLIDLALEKKGDQTVALALPVPAVLHLLEEAGTRGEQLLKRALRIRRAQKDRESRLRMGWRFLSASADAADLAARVAKIASWTAGGAAATALFPGTVGAALPAAVGGTLGFCQFVLDVKEIKERVSNERLVFRLNRTTKSSLGHACSRLISRPH